MIEGSHNGAGTNSVTLNQPTSETPIAMEQMTSTFPANSRQAKKTCVQCRQRKVKLLASHAIDDTLRRDASGQLFHPFPSLSTFARIFGTARG